MAPEAESDRLSADDAHILDMESSVITGHTLKLVVLEPGDAPLDIGALQDSVAHRLADEPRATQRVDGSGSRARWVPADDFDITHHVRRHLAGPCVTRADLWSAVSELMCEHLDRDRPLWTFDVIGPLADGREAIAARIHHAMADGIAGVRFLHAVLWDPHPELPATAGVAPGLRTVPPVGVLAEVRRLPGAIRRELGHRAADSPFDRPITGSRELAFVPLGPLTAMKAIGGSRPERATVNDVLLAAVAGGLRSWLGVDGGAGPHLHAQIPVSLHHRDEGATELGNRDSFMNIDLPLGEVHPLRRLDLISAQTRLRKEMGDAESLYDLFHALGRITPLGGAVRRFADSSREFSVAISNVPGPRAAVGVAGRRVQHLFSSSEPALHHALRISAISCAGDVGIGLCVDPSALPNVAVLADGIEDSFSALHGAVERARQ